MAKSKTLVAVFCAVAIVCHLAAAPIRAEDARRVSRVASLGLPNHDVGEPAAAPRHRHFVAWLKSLVHRKKNKRRNTTVWLKPVPRPPSHGNRAGVAQKHRIIVPRKPALNQTEKKSALPPPSHLLTATPEEPRRLYSIGNPVPRGYSLPEGDVSAKESVGTESTDAAVSPPLRLASTPRNRDGQSSRPTDVESKSADRTADSTVRPRAAYSAVRPGKASGASQSTQPPAVLPAIQPPALANRMESPGDDGSTNANQGRDMESSGQPAATDSEMPDPESARTAELNFSYPQRPMSLAKPESKINAAEGRGLSALIEKESQSTFGGMVSAAPRQDDKKPTARREEKPVAESVQWPFETASTSRKPKAPEPAILDAVLSLSKPSDSVASQLTPNERVNDGSSVVQQTSTQPAATPIPIAQGSPKAGADVISAGATGGDSQSELSVIGAGGRSAETASIEPAKRPGRVQGRDPIAEALREAKGSGSVEERKFALRKLSTMRNWRRHRLAPIVLTKIALTEPDAGLRKNSVEMLGTMTEYHEIAAETLRISAKYDGDGEIRGLAEKGVRFLTASN